MVLLVDAAQGIEAQTLANCYLALEHDLEIVACLNKIDLPAAEPDRYAAEIEKVLGIPAEEVLRISAKTGEGVAELLDAVIDRIPAPGGRRRRAAAGPDLRLATSTSTGAWSARSGSWTAPCAPAPGSASCRPAPRTTPTRSASASPDPTPVDALGPGETGYLIAGIKDVGEARSGETVTDAAKPATEALEGYQDPKPMVFCGLYPIDGDEFPELREALEKLRLNDSSFTYEPETSGALGFGFRCGFLGLLHMEIVRERLEREFDLSLIATAPSVAYRVHTTKGEVVEVDNPREMPPPQEIEEIEEPWLDGHASSRPPTTRARSWTSARPGGARCSKLEYLSPERVELRYRVPLAEVVTDFFDQMKSRTQGYASLDYEPDGYAGSNLVKVDVLLNGQPVDAFSTIVHRDKADDYGRRMTEKLRELIPRQLFDVPIQAAVGGPDHRPRDGQGEAQGRAGQVLRRRHHPQAQAAREAEGGQEADEVDRPGRGPPGGVRLRPPPRRLARASTPAPTTGRARVP